MEVALINKKKDLETKTIANLKKSYTIKINNIYTTEYNKIINFQTLQHNITPIHTNGIETKS